PADLHATRPHPGHPGRLTRWVRSDEPRRRPAPPPAGGRQRLPPGRDPRGPGADGPRRALRKDLYQDLLRGVRGNRPAFVSLRVVEMFEYFSPARGRLPNPGRWAKPAPIISQIQPGLPSRP